MSLIQQNDNESDSHSDTDVVMILNNPNQPPNITPMEVEPVNQRKRQRDDNKGDFVDTADHSSAMVKQLITIYQIL